MITERRAIDTAVAAIDDVTSELIKENSLNNNVSSRVFEKLAHAATVLERLNYDQLLKEPEALQFEDLIYPAEDEDDEEENDT